MSGESIREQYPETMILCSGCDWPTCICDFCKYYQSDGDSKQCCEKHFLQTDLLGGCEYFHCWMAK